MGARTKPQSAVSPAFTGGGAGFRPMYATPLWVTPTPNYKAPTTRLVLWALLEYPSNGQRLTNIT
jgi:hypothetical protein